MRKINKEYDDFFDNIYLTIIEHTVGIFYLFGFTPNMITLISTIIGLFSIINFQDGMYFKSAILFAISYYFDCMDGYMSRQYNMITKFGDYFDHIKDICVIAYMIYSLAIHNIYIFYFLIPFGIMSYLHLACQEVFLKHKYKEDHEGDSLTLMLKIFPYETIDDVTELLKKTRYCGCGTFNLIVCIMIALCYYI